MAEVAPSEAGREGRERLSLRVVAGPTLIGEGNVLSAAFGYSAASRLELLLNVERRLTSQPKSLNTVRQSGHHAQRPGIDSRPGCASRRFLRAEDGGRDLR